MPHGDIPLALFDFNVGVEVGQLAFIAMMPMLVAAAKMIALSVWVLKSLGGSFFVVAMVALIGGLTCFLREVHLTTRRNLTRDNAVMSALAKPLTRKEIAELAEYFSKQHGLFAKR